MNLDLFAQRVLFGTLLEDKLSGFNTSTAGDFQSSKHTSPLLDAPKFPGRPPGLLKIGKVSFPPVSRMHDSLVRGEMLHFFANHELLALELMALILLKFPEAPEAFRLGLAHTIQEEQTHLRLYIARMRELGVEFGDLPVSDYFWKSMSGIQSPLDFVVQMSITFEQANLDYSLYFMKAAQIVGDDVTARILEKVFQDEIGHVKNGVTWFNRWREQVSGESDWDAYCKLLPSPMTPRRAKGFEFTAEPRRHAGLSEIFIQELSVFTGSKGRPPVVWLYNPNCDAEIARGSSGYSAPKNIERITRDLESLPMYLALDDDLVLVKEKPNSTWIAGLQTLGISTPEFGIYKGKSLSQSVRPQKISGIEPWGWSPESFELFTPLRKKIVTLTGTHSQWCENLLTQPSYEATGLSPIFSKSWSSDFFKQYLFDHPDPEIFGDSEITSEIAKSLDKAVALIQAQFDQGHTAMIKAPYGTSGMSVREVRAMQELSVIGPEAESRPLIGWIRRILETQGEIVVERYLPKVCDLSIQIEIGQNCIRCLEVRKFITGSRHEYRGTFLGSKLPGFEAKELRFLHSGALEKWRRLVQKLGEKLRDLGYQGPAGIDALLWRNAHGALRLKPLVELNPRWTMGRVALELEKHLYPGVPGAWAIIPLRWIQTQGYSNIQEFAQFISSRYPPQIQKSGGGLRIQSGVVFTNDPSQAQTVLTALFTFPCPELEAVLTSANRRIDEQTQGQGEPDL